MKRMPLALFLAAMVLAWASSAQSGPPVMRGDNANSHRLGTLMMLLAIDNLQRRPVEVDKAYSNERLMGVAVLQPDKTKRALSERQR